MGRMGRMGPNGSRPTNLRRLTKVAQASRLWTDRNHRRDACATLSACICYLRTSPKPAKPEDSPQSFMNLPPSRRVIAASAESLGTPEYDENELGQRRGGALPPPKQEGQGRCLAPT